MPDANKAFNILTINQISPVGLKNFPPNYYHIGNDLANPNAILVRSHNMHAMEIPESVIAIGRAGAGTNNVPVDTMNQRGIPVFNTPGANANAVKELVLASILLAARNLTPALNFINGLQGDDAALHKQAEDGKKRFSGIELPGRTLGIIGLGEIGRLVADAALKLGMKVVGEGVETKDQQDFLLQHQCDQLQGYLFSKPVSEQTIFELLEAQSSFFK